MKVQIEGLRLLLEEKNQGIEDLRIDKETLSIFAHYFKSLKYKRLDAATQETTSAGDQGDFCAGYCLPGERLRKGWRDDPEDVQVLFYDLLKLQTQKRRHAPTNVNWLL